MELALWITIEHQLASFPSFTRCSFVRSNIGLRTSSATRYACHQGCGPKLRRHLISCLPSLCPHVQMSVRAQPDNHGRRVLSGAMSVGIASSTETTPSIGWNSSPFARSIDATRNRSGARGGIGAIREQAARRRTRKESSHQGFEKCAAAHLRRYSRCKRQVLAFRAFYRMAANRFELRSCVPSQPLYRNGQYRVVLRQQLPVPIEVVLNPCETSTAKSV